MLDIFMPDGRFDTFTGLSGAFLASVGVKLLLTDIDNTLAPYEVPVPDAAVCEWVDSMKKAGVEVVLVSNNNEERVSLFNESLGLSAYPDCHKPSKKALFHILEEKGASPAETAALGDQVFTDVLGAHRIGARAYLVPPIRDKKTLFFRFKRLLEKPILAVYERKKKHNVKG